MNNDNLTLTFIKQLPRRSKSVINKTSYCRQNNRASDQAQVNIAIVGDLGVGKSALTVKYITRRFINEYDPNLEDTYDKYENLDEQDITVRIMDTCDMQNGKDPDRYLNWANAFLVVYSITSRPSFEMAKNYMETIAQHQRMASTIDIPVILVGNKVDMERYRQVSKSEGRTLAALYDSSFSETTATEEYESIADVFHEAIREVLREYERNTPLHPLLIIEERTTKSAPPQLRVGTPRSPRPPRIDMTLHNNQRPATAPATAGVLLNNHEKNSRFRFFNKSGKGFKSIFQSI